MVDYSEMDDNVLKQKNQERVTSVEKFEARSWDRDNIDQRLSEVQSNVDTIETILQDINEQVNLIPSEDDLRDKWSKYLERKPTDSKGDEEELPRQFFEAERDRSELLLRQAIWQARLKELERFTRKKLSAKFSGLLDEHQTLKAKGSLEDILEVQDKVSRMDTMLSQIEKMGQAFREERNTLWTMVERVAEKESSSVDMDEVEELVRDATEDGLEQFVTSKGMFTLDEDELEKDSKREELDSTAESIAESTVENTDSKGKVFELKGKEPEEQYEVLEDLAAEFEPLENDWNQSDVAEVTDVTPAALFKDGGIVDRVNDHDYFPAVDVRE